MHKSIGWELGLSIERNRAAAFRAIRSEISRLTLAARARTRDPDTSPASFLRLPRLSHRTPQSGTFARNSRERVRDFSGETIRAQHPP